MARKTAAAAPAPKIVARRRARHVDDTRRALLAAARRAFARKGFAATSLEDIVGPARLTKGALYHHFDSKAAIFEALYVEMGEALLAQVAAAVEAAPGGAWEAAIAALDAFFAASADPEYVRIVLRDAPLVLGPLHGRTLDQEIGLAYVCKLVEALQAEGLVPDLPVTTAARVLLATTGEMAIASAYAEDPARTRREGRQVLLAVLDGWRASAARGRVGARARVRAPFLG